MRVVIGRVARAHGVQGELAVDVSTDSPEVRFAPGAAMTARLRGADAGELTVSAARGHGARLLLRYAEVTGREDAEALRGALLLADTDELPPTADPDEFYDHQLEGLAVYTVDGTRVGTVTEMLHGPGGELLSVDRDGQELLVPFVRQIVPDVDLERGRVTIDPPEGLLEA